MSSDFGSIFNKKINNVGITVEYIDQKTLQPQIIQLNLSENLSKIRHRLDDRGIINSTLSFVRKFGNSRFAEIAFEEEKNISLNEIVRKIEDTRILSLTTCSKFNWKVLNQLRKLDYGCTMTPDGIKKADKRAFEMKDCIFEEIGNEECKAGEFNSSSCEEEMIDKNLFFNTDINVKYFVKLGIGKSFRTSDNKTSQVKTDYSYSFTKYGKALLKLKYEHLEPTPEFIEVVKKAISSEDPAEQFKQIFQDFGQFIPTEVILGGRIHYAKTVKLSTKKSNDYSYKYAKIIGGKQPDDIKNLDIGSWASSLNNYRCWDCIEFRNPISIFQFLPKDLHERIIKSVGMTIHHSAIETCDLVLKEYRKPIQFKLEIPTNIRKIIKNKDVDCKILATVTDITKSKNDFFTCLVLFPSDGKLPSLIIHRVQTPLKIFKERECKLRIGWMVIGYYRDFNFDFSTRLKVQKNDFNAPDKDNLIEYDSKVPICLGTPVLSEYPKNESLIIGHYYYVQEENNKIKACTFAYCLEERHLLVNLPKFTFYTLIITNYHNHDACNIITLKKEEYSNFNTESPKFASIYTTEQTNCLFLKQRNGQIKIKEIGNDNKTILSVKCAVFDPYLPYGDVHLDKLPIQEESMISSLKTTNDQQDEPVKNEKTTKYHDSLDEIAAFNNQLGNKDDIINKLQQQTEKLGKQLSEEIRKYEVSQEDIEILKKELKLQLDEETRRYQVSQDKLADLKDQLKIKEEFIEKLQSKLDSLKNKEEELQNKLNEETRKCQDCLDKLKNKEKIIEELQSQMDNYKKEISALLSQIQTQHAELGELVNYVGKKHDFGRKGRLLMDNILEKQRNIILTNDNFASEELEEIKQKLIVDCELTEEEIRDILHKQAEKTKLDVQLKSMIQGESMISSSTKNDQSNEHVKNSLLSKQQIIQKFKLNHGLFLDGYSIKPSKNAVYVEDGKLNISLCKDQPFIYTFINNRNSHINLLKFNSNDNINNIKINKALQLLDMCINFPVIEITYAADLSESFKNFKDDNENEMYGHLFPRKILIGGKLFVDDLKSATSTQIDMFKSFLTWIYDSAKYKKEIPFNNFTTLKFFPKVTTADGDNLNTYDKLTNWMNNLYRKNKSDIIISYNNLVPISELGFGTSSSSVDEIQPGISNFEEKLSLREWVKDSIYVNLTRWIKEFRLFQGLIINKHFELENSKKIAVNFINVPNVNSSDKLYLEMIRPITTLEEFLQSNNVNKFLNKDITLLPFIKNSIKSVNLSYEDYTHFMIKCERYRILLSKADIKPSEEFEQAIEEALENMKPFTFLQDVFDKYGYFYPLNIVLGKSLKSILPNSSLPFTFKKMESLFESLTPFLDNFNVSYFLTKKGNTIIEKDDLPKWIQSTNNDLEIIEFDNVISLYDVLKEEQQRNINIILNAQNNTKIVMTGIDDLEDLNINNTEHYKRINLNPSLENGKYEVFGSIISKDKKENLKSDFFVRFGLYDSNGFSAMIKTLNKNSEINITECYILWMITGIPSELLVFSPRNRELPVNRIKKSIALRNDNSDSNYSIETSHQLSQGDIISINIYCLTTNYEPINVKLIGWSKNRIIFQILKPIYNNSNLNNSTSSIASSDDGDDTDSLPGTETIAEETIDIDICVCILSSEYERLKIDNKEQGCHSCHLNLIGYTLTEENFNEELLIKGNEVDNEER